MFSKKWKYRLQNPRNACFAVEILSLKCLFSPSEMGNFGLFQPARCEVSVKYTIYNLLEHEWIRTGIRTLETQIDGKKKNMEAWQNVTGSYKKSV